MATSSILQDDDPSMDGGMQMPDRDAEQGGPDKIECYIPVENIKEDGVEPQEGDEVEFSVRGTVTKVTDGIACIDPLEINGSPASEGSQDAQGPEHETNDGQDDLDALEKKAMPMLAARDKHMGF